MRYLSLFIFIFIAFLVKPTNGYAAHYLGGEITYINIKNANNQPTDFYKWRVVLYVDRTFNFAHNTFTLHIHKNSNSAIETSLTLNKINALTYLNFPESACPVKQAQNMVEYAVYESDPINHANLNDPMGYYAIYTLCCVNSFSNMFSSNYSAMNYIDFKALGTTSVVRFNSSPQFTTPVMQYIKVGRFYTLDWSAIDPDGDSLVYLLDTPKLGNGPKSNWTMWQYYQGYSTDSNIADGNPDFRINAQTGIATYQPVFMGNYIVSLSVHEYRKINGVAVKVGESSRSIILLPTIPQDIYPVLFDSLRNTTVYDTLLANTPINKVISFAAMDPENDSLFIKILPDKTSASNNILDTNLIKVSWKGMSGPEYTGVDAENYIIKRKSTSIAYLTIDADSNHVSNLPYKFKIVCYKKNCPYLLTDTVNYELIIKGDKCYNTTLSNIYVCDSFLAANGNTYFQSEQLVDTLVSSIGCDMIRITNLNITTSPSKPIISGDFNISDTSKFYTYTVDSQVNVIYQWGGFTNVSFIAGQNTPTLTLKWKVANAQESIDCYVYRNNCFDSTYVNIIVSHLVGINTSSVNNINVYPNPVSDVLTFDIKNNLEHANISIYNTLGQMLQQSTLHNNELIVAVLPEGVYQFVLSKGTQQFRGTFIKE